MNNDTDNYDKRVRLYEAEGLTRSDAQGVVDAEDMKAARAMNITLGPWLIYPRNPFDNTIPIGNGTKLSPLAYISPRPHYADNQEANARAIAEVPNLIEAIREFLNFCPRVSENDPIASALANQCQYAKLILKRIEG